MKYESNKIVGNINKILLIKENFNILNIIGISREGDISDKYFGVTAISSITTPETFLKVKTDEDAIFDEYIETFWVKAITSSRSNSIPELI